MVELCLSQNFDVNQKNLDGTTALHWAVWSTDSRIVDMLLSKRADTNIQDNYGLTPYHIACYLKLNPIISSLKNSGAEELQDIYENKPSQMDITLWQAIEKHSFLDIKDLLLNSDVNVQNDVLFWKLFQIIVSNVLFS